MLSRKDYTDTHDKGKQMAIEAIKEEPTDANLATASTKRSSNIVPNANAMESLKVFTVIEILQLFITFTHAEFLYHRLRNLDHTYKN